MSVTAPPMAAPQPVAKLEESVRIRGPDGSGVVVEGPGGVVVARARVGPGPGPTPPLPAGGPAGTPVADDAAHEGAGSPPGRPATVNDVASSSPTVALTGARPVQPSSESNVSSPACREQNASARMVGSTVADGNGGVRT